MSLWQIATAESFTFTSPGPASASVTSSMTSGFPNSRQTAAFMTVDSFFSWGFRKNYYLA
jgi:hypothetical protein